MSTFGRLFFSFIKGLRNGWSYLNCWAEKHYDLIETESVALNGPPEGWIYSPVEMRERRRVTSYRLSTPLPVERQQPPPEVLAAPTPPTPVTSDDVLDMHLFLQDFNGDFQRLFEESE